MGSLVQEVKRWAVEELDLPPQSLPHDSYIKTLCVGTGASIWKYVTQHVYSERQVRLIRGNLQWYKILQDKELKQVETQNKDARRLDLQRQISELHTELNHIDDKLVSAEEQLTHQEQCVSRQWGQYEQSRLRAVMLDSFRLRCAEDRDALVCDTQTISGRRETFQQLSRKAEVKVVFGGSAAGDGDAATEPLVLKNVRDLCRERVVFFQSLQDSTLKSSSSSEFTPEQRDAAYQHWLSAVQDVLRSHPPNQVLSALHALACKQQVALEDKTAALDVERDLSALGFRYESNHLHDVSVQEEEEDDLPPVRSLLQAAWEEVEQSYVRLAEVRTRARRLHTDLGVLTKEVQQRILGQDDVINPAARVLELEMQVVRQAAVRDSMREQCVRLQQENREKAEALRSLHTQRQNIMEFRRCVDARQEQIRCLIRGNSSLKTELVRVHSESRQFMQDLSPKFGALILSANQLRNSVSQEAKLFHSVCLAALDRRTVNGERVPLDQLSVSRVNSPALRSVRQSLGTPLFMAPELLFPQAVSQKLQLRFLRRLQQLRADSLTDIQNRTAQLPAPNQQALLQRVKMEDAELLQSLLPRVKLLSRKCSEGVAYASQINTTITHWWEQPAQFALPEMQQEELNFQQWLQRWKRATKEL